MNFEPPAPPACVQVEFPAPVRTPTVQEMLHDLSQVLKSRAAVAAALEVNAKTVQAYEAGRQRPGKEVVDRLKRHWCRNCEGGRHAGFVSEGRPEPEGTEVKLKETARKHAEEHKLAPTAPAASLEERVNHPAHYKNAGLAYKEPECIEFTRNLGFMTGNILKYVWRAGLKGDMEAAREDLNKARWYLKHRDDGLEFDDSLEARSEMLVAADEIAQTKLNILKLLVKDGGYDKNAVANLIAQLENLLLG